VAHKLLALLGSDVARAAVALAFLVDAAGDPDQGGTLWLEEEDPLLLLELEHVVEPLDTLPGEAVLFTARCDSGETLFVTSFRVVLGRRALALGNIADLRKAKPRTLVMVGRELRVLKVGLTSPGAFDKAFHVLKGLLLKNSLERCKTLCVSEEQRHGWSLFNEVAELQRMNIPDTLRLFDQSEEYSLCATYPRHLIIPADVSEETLQGSAAFRSHGRLPVVTWVHPTQGSLLARCAQPLTGLRNNSNTADEELVAKLVKPTDEAKTLEHKQPSAFPFGGTSSSSFSYVIMDARSQMASMGNQVLGKGTENPANYAGALVRFLNIGNIHTLRSSFEKLFALATSPPTQTDFYRAVSDTGWIQHVLAVLKASTALASTLHDDATNVLTHCSDGWDRTAQMCSLAMLLLDPYFRTLRGFAVLVEKEWCAFGHKFKDRTQTRFRNQEFSPVFTLWIDCVWQLTRQFPKEFEFNAAFLIAILDEVSSSRFGTFLFNSQRERHSAGVPQSTASIWSSVVMSDPAHRNEFFAPTRTRLEPSLSTKKVLLWTKYFFRHDPDHLIF
ncbi:5-bisphosphate 3-phosphatase) (Phosphatidylinositol-3-phosphate phosphatase), partial [Durusdinium trenchii]